MLTPDQLRSKANSIRSMGGATIEAHDLEDIADFIENMRDATRELIEAKNGPAHRWIEAKHQAEMLCEQR